MRLALARCFWRPALVSIVMVSCGYSQTAPTFSASPSPQQSVVIGKGLTLTAAATGSPPPAYQWMYNGQVIAGATSSTLVLSAATPALDDGWYQVSATNSAGTALSPVIFVNVSITPAQIVAWGNNDSGQTTIPSGIGAVSAVAAGGDFALALEANGTVVGWGDNSSGQTAPPSTLSNAVAVAAGFDSSFALRADGTVISWGGNDSGLLNVPANLTGVVAISAGSNHVLALLANGTVIAWGDNSAGQISVPPGLSNVVAVSARNNISTAVQADGNVVVWGGSVANKYGAIYPAPVAPASLGSVISVSQGSSHGVALLNNGTATAWGDNAYNESTIPPFEGDLAGVFAGDQTTALLNSNGALIAWGYDDVGQIDVPMGLSNVVAAAAGPDFFIAISNSSTPLTPYAPVFVATSLATQQSGAYDAFSVGYPTPTYTWFQNGLPISGATSATYTVQFPKTGSNSTENRYPYEVDGYYRATASNSAGTAKSPFAFFNLEFVNAQVIAWGDNSTGEQIIPSAMSDFFQVAAGSKFAIAVVADGGVAAWGDNTFGQTAVPASLSGAVSVAAGDSTSYALLGNGTVVAWGENDAGETTVPAGLSNVVQISAQGSHALALKDDGTVVAWGDNTYGESTVPAGLSGVAGVAAGTKFSMALKSDGTVVAWGDNAAKETTVPSGLNEVILISAGIDHAVALLSNGTVVSWGDNTEGQAIVPPGLATIVGIQARGDYTMVEDSTGLVTEWGAVPSGTVPVAPTKMYVAEVVAGTNFSMAVVTYPAPLAVDMNGSQGAVASSSIVSTNPSGVIWTVTTPSGTTTVPGATTTTPPTVAGGGVLTLQETSSNGAVATFTVPPSISEQPQSATVVSGQPASFSVTAESAATYQWQFDNADITGATASTYSISATNSANQGIYDVVVTNDAGSVTSTGATLTVTPPPVRLVNISTRAQVGTGANLLIPGFVISGSGTETLLLRADGPSLSQFGVSGVLAQPSLSLLDNTQKVVASNTAWGTGSNAALIASTAAQVGAFALPAGSADCALLVSLPAGAYTVQVSGVNNSTGVALAEIYEVSATGTRLSNISTRALVGTGADIVIPGFVVSGAGTEQLLVRADGPGLTQFGVTGVLAQPSLSVVNSAGTTIASNAVWASSPDAALIASTAAEVGAFTLAAGSADSAAIVSVTSGAYTMPISGVKNSSGVALGEIYEVQ